MEERVPSRLSIAASSQATGTHGNDENGYTPLGAISIGKALDHLGLRQCGLGSSPCTSRKSARTHLGLVLRQATIFGYGPLSLTWEFQSTDRS